MSEEITLGGTPVALPAEGDKEFIVAVSQKASTAYVKQVAANLDAKKVDKTTYDAKMAAIDSMLGEGDGNLGGRVSALEAYDATVPGLISSAVDAEETRATGVEAGLRTDVDAATAAIAVLNGADTEAGSVAKAVKDEAGLRAAADEALDARLDVIEGSGEGSVAKALADAKAYADGKETTLQAAIDGKVDKNGTDRLMTVAEGEKLAALPTNDALTTSLNGKVDKVTGSSLVADTEISKLAQYPAYSEVEADIDSKVAIEEGKGLVPTADITKLAGLDDQTTLQGKIDAKANAADMTAALALKADTSTVNSALALKANAADVYIKSEVDSAISAAAAAVFRYKGSKDAIASLPSEGNVTGDVWHVATAGTNGSGAEYVWNGTAWEELGTAVNLSAYSTTEQMNAAIAAAVLVEENRAKGVEGGLDTRLTTAEGDIDALETRAGSIESAATALAGRVTTAESDIDALETRAGNIETAATALTGRVDTAEADIDGVQAALGTLTAAGSVETAISNAQSAAVTAAGTAADSKIETAIGALTVNGQSFVNNAAVVSGGEITLGASYVAGQDDVVALTSASTVAGAFDAVVDHLNTLDAVTGGATADLTQMSADIDAIEAALPIAQFNGTNTVKAAIDAVDTAKVDKVSGSSLVADTEISKLAGYPAYSVVTGALDTKVDKVAGSSLVADAQITKLEGLNDQASTDAALAGKVDKVEGSGLIEATKVAKLDALPTNAQLNELLAAKVDKQPAVAGASVVMEAGKRYVVKGEFAGTLPAGAADGAMVEIFVLVGGSGRLVSAASGDTILGQNLPCAIGISEEGWTLDNESYTFIYDATNSNWHVL